MSFGSRRAKSRWYRGKIAYVPCMRQEHRVAFVFWTRWIWFEAWGPTVKALSRSSLVSRFVIGAFIVGLSGFAAVERGQKASDQIHWFVWNNLIGAAAIFSIIFIWNWLLAPGRLLARDIVRELVRDWVAVINGKIGEAGRLIEAIRLGRDISAATIDFERWREETRRFLSENFRIMSQSLMTSKWVHLGRCLICPQNFKPLRLPDSRPI